ncbi:hypothetical protein CW304_06855 [Bacillus sp. UFRGS-B20]|nr:hypothetical protein CW304_06855 [Bacillus sp. UFRGS-B20]
MLYYPLPCSTETTTVGFSVSSKQQGSLSPSRYDIFSSRDLPLYFSLTPFYLLSLCLERFTVFFSKILSMNLNSLNLRLLLLLFLLKHLILVHPLFSIFLHLHYYHYFFVRKLLVFLVLEFFVL